MSIAPMICPLALRSPRFDMDHTDEPQKKIFKARKTMKVSDRQQLEVVYKVKEDFKLMNGKHENGDSDVSSLNETDCMEDKKELTGMLDVCVDPNIGNSGPKGVTVRFTSDTMENRGVQDTDSNLTIDPLPADEINYKKDINVFSAQTDGQMLETNEEINFIAKNDTIAQKLDQMDPLSCSVSVSELCCGKDYVEETVVESGSDKTSSLFSEEIVLKSHSEELVVVERQLGENLVKEDLVMVEAEPEISLNEQQVYLNELPLEKPHSVEKVDGPQLPEPGNIQHHEILEDLPSGILAKDLQQNAEVLTEPELDVIHEEIEMTVERVETNLEAQPMIETVQELVQQSVAETGPVFIPQTTGILAQDSEEASLIEQRSQQDLIEDQLLEDLAEEQQFGEELAEDILLEELVEDQPPENVLSQCEVANLVVDELKTSEEKDLDVSNMKAKPLEMVEKPDVVTVMEEKNPQELEDCESECADIAENTENKQLLEQQDATDDFKQKEEGTHDSFEHCAEMECNWDEGEKVEEMEEGKTLQENNLFEDAGEGAISSSMEMPRAPLVVDTTLPKPLTELQNSGCCMEKSESMETDDIIPILEKLAPVEDRLASFSKPPLLSEVDPNPELEDKIDCQSSLSKPEQSENLPSEAFLVLSDEEDSCVEEVAPSAVPPSQSTTENEAARLSEKQLDANEEEPNKDTSPPERSETTRRKRSKSEDLDSAQFKRRRYEGEEYEAELQVKITARADVDQKLQTVIQRLLEEKLCALQCAVFDKTLADLKSRVEKIECKKHEIVLHGIQAKIARLSKRFGAAKEDLKKRQETQSVQPVQPVQPESPGKAASDGTNNLVQRNVGTVRHMLESKRAGDVPASSFQAPANAAPPSLLAQPPPLQAAPNQVLTRIAPTPSSQSPITVTTQARQMPDWKLIQQRISATHLAPPQPKPQTPVTSTQMMTPVLSSNAAAAVVGTSQVSGGSGGPMPVSLQSLQSLPMILHVPVMQSTMQNATVMQSTTGTLVTNQHSGNIEFIPSQNQGNVGALKTPGSLTPTITTKQNNGLSLPSPTMQRNSPASAASSGPTLSLHAVSVAHSVAQAVRTSLPTVSTAGQYTTTNSRTSLQMKVQTASFSSPSSSEPPATSRPDLQINRTPMSEAIVAKRAAESTTQLSGSKVDLNASYTCGQFDKSALVNCFENLLKKEQSVSDDEERVEAAQSHFSSCHDSLFGLEEEVDPKSVKNTYKQTVWSANLLRHWLLKHNKSPKFEQLSSKKLNDILREFYYTLRSQEGNAYSVASYRSIRAGLNRHLRAPPYSRHLCLISDKEFASANLVFVNVLQILRMGDEDVVQPMITIEELQKMKRSGVLCLPSSLAMVNKGGKPGAGVIDLTLDDDEANSSQDGRKTNSVNISGINQLPPILPRPPQLPQTALVQQNAMSAGMPTQTTIHVLPTAQTTVNVNHRPMAQSMPRLSGPRTPTNHQVVYTALPSTPIQSPVRNAVMHGQTPGLRQISPQTGGVAIRMPQTAYVVNNGMTVGSAGPQLTVHHRPPQVRSEPVRTIHPAPLPEAPQPQRLPPEAANTSLPQKPHLKLARVQSQNGIVLSWSVLEVDRSCASVDSYHLYAYHEDPTASTPSQWKKIGEVKALPLPMACTLTQFVSGSKYYFAVRAKDVYGRFGVFCDPQSTDVIATQNS